MSLSCGGIKSSFRSWGLLVNRHHKNIQRLFHHQVAKGTKSGKEQQYLLTP